MRTTLVLAVLVGAPLVAVAGPKDKAKDKEVKAHLARAAKAHKDGKFDVALVELQAAYDLEPKPDLQYALGQIYVKLGKCGEAHVAYEKFVEVHKDAATAVQQALAACKEAEPPPPVAAEPPAPPPPAIAEPPPPPPPPKPAPPPRPVVHDDTPFAPPPVATSHRARPWYTDKLGDALVVGGVAAGVVGIVMYRGAVKSLDDAEHAPTLDRYKSLVDDAHAKRTYSIVLIGGGTALVGAGLLHYMLHDRGTETHAVGIVPTSGGGVVTWGGPF